MIKILFPLWGLLLWNTTITAQQVAYQKPMAATDSLVPAKEIILKGKVFSGDERTGIPGATARVKVGNKGTTTLADGSYSLKVHENSTVIFSQMGYISQQIPVN